MVEVTNFLLRWLYLCNLIRDRAEIQSLPHVRHHHYHPEPPPPLQHSNTILQEPPPPPDQTQSYPPHGQLPPHAPLPPVAPLLKSSHGREALLAWKEQCLRGLALYPPGQSRLLALDALRLECIHYLASGLQRADETVRRLSSSVAPADEYEDDPYRDADLEILQEFQRSSWQDNKRENGDKKINEGEQIIKGDEGNKEHDSKLGDDEGSDEALLVITKDGRTNVTPKSIHRAADSEHINDEESYSKLKRQQGNPQTKGTGSSAEDCVSTLSEEERERQLLEAQKILLEAREYLPQLVSTVLHSPPAWSAPVLDPLAVLRKLLVNQCLIDPNLGIELCWLLEAEVGRAWKTLFEHRQQTGRRLIVVLPAEKAAVIAKIGTEKRAAFDLLQDAEQASAYGSNLHDDTNDDVLGHDMNMPPQPPASLSLRRCSYFGDTMHFIDRLTQVSLDLTRVPHGQRMDCLQDRLQELNRRLRRRMVTEGEISLDVEDGLGPHDWPRIKDLQMELLKYSIHFPLEPKSVSWPGTDDYLSSSSIPQQKPKRGVMRVLNIVSSECRILASRERCPFLIQLEVVETGLEGNDARLYASGVRGLGTTLEESLGIGSSSSQTQSQFPHGFSKYRIPSELLQAKSPDTKAAEIARSPPTEEMEASIPNNAKIMEQPRDASNISARGGWQGDDGEKTIQGNTEEYLSAQNSYDTVRQQEIEQLHQQMQSQQQYHWQQHQQNADQYAAPGPTYTVKSALLDKVFGLPFATRSDQIRQTSPFGKVKGWKLASFIMKAGEDIRREALVMQLIAKLKGWFDEELPEDNRPYLRPYTIMCVGGDAGLLECLPDAKSIDEIKKDTDGFTSLRDYFERAYGPPKRSPHNMGNTSPAITTTQASSPTGVIGDLTFEQAQDNFLRSLVGYSLVCFILQIKDRHNANILLNREGYLMHIDFGFVLGDMPKMAKVPIFNERAPFKLTQEFWDVIGGWNFNEGGLGVRFCKMFEAAFACASSHSDEISNLIEAAVLNLTRDPDEARSLANGVRSRLMMRGPPGSSTQKTFIMGFINTALNSLHTTVYDWLQNSMNGYQ
mmetsp:Transcript_26437/g.47977  ORF Transcript_26437/g.47977 Transcript_26437/m.47977 type:complete len:1070 (-) Transcript_26437:18-3227(-)